MLGEWAVHFHGTYMRTGKVRDQLFNLHESPEHGFSHVSGTAEQLAEQCAAWFETLLSRPVVRREWVHESSVYAMSWAFADTEEALVSSVNHAVAPASFTSHTGGRVPRVRHDRCTLVRGASQQHPGPHAPLC